MYTRCYRPYSPELGSGARDYLLIWKLSIIFTHRNFSFLFVLNSYTLVILLYISVLLSNTVQSTHYCTLSVLLKKTVMFGWSYVTLLALYRIDLSGSPQIFTEDLAALHDKCGARPVPRNQTRPNYIIHVCLISYAHAQMPLVQ